MFLCAAKAGIRIIGTEELNCAKNLLVAADTNAVPPSGVEGIGIQDNGDLVEYANVTFHSIGSLAIGNIKYKTQFGLFEKMQNSSESALIDFPDAYEFALSILENS